jgi:hypothetical protein
MPAYDLHPYLREIAAPREILDMLFEDIAAGCSVFVLPKKEYTNA